MSRVFCVPSSWPRNFKAAGLRPAVSAKHAAQHLFEVAEIGAEGAAVADVTQARDETLQILIGGDHENGQVDAQVTARAIAAAHRLNYPAEGGRRAVSRGADG